MASSAVEFQWLEGLSVGQSAVLIAVGAGLLGLVLAFCLSGRGSDSKTREEEKHEANEPSAAVTDKKAEPPKKQWKVKNAGKSRKTTLPSHRLLAADLKGHTAAVLSLDFDSSGKYLVSCSEGSGRFCKISLSLSLSLSRSDNSSVVYEDTGRERAQVNTV